MVKPVAVVIPHYKAPDELEKCIQAVQYQIGVETEIFVRENSFDNILFTRAINEGLRRFCYSDQYDFVLILNQDAYLRPNCLSHLLNVMHANSTAGITSPIQVNKNNQITWGGSLQAYPYGVHAGGDIESTNPPFKTYWANGACMLFRISMVREIGLLDENMRFICSDSDYSFMARSRGWDVVVVPPAVVEHSLNASGKSTDAWLTEVKLKDQIYFAEKWLTGGVYRSLALEGKDLTFDFVQQEVQKSRDYLAHIQEVMEKDKYYKKWNFKKLFKFVSNKCV